MATIFENLQNDSQYKASTGLNQEEFDRLHEEFKLYYQAKAYNQIAKKAPVLRNSREALFFILFYYKSHPTLEVLGLSFGFSNTVAFGYVDYVKPYLKRALQGQSVLVKRVFDNQEAFDKAFEGITDLFIDGSEIIIERAKDPKSNRLTSQAKKTHTLIMLLICDAVEMYASFGFSSVASPWKLLNFKISREIKSIMQAPNSLCLLSRGWCA